jgi:hypothetical protein
MQMLPIIGAENEKNLKPLSNEGPRIKGSWLKKPVMPQFSLKQELIEFEIKQNINVKSKFGIVYCRRGDQSEQDMLRNGESGWNSI